MNPDNPMRDIRIEKVVVNIHVGAVGEQVEKAKTLLERLTGSQAVRTVTRQEARTFGLRHGLETGVKTTLRGEQAETFLERMFEAKEEIPRRSFTEHGHVSFGIGEYLSVPDVKYDPNIGMFGFEVTVNLERPGYRVKRRKNRQRKVGKNHRVSQDEAITFIKNRFGVNVS